MRTRPIVTATLVTCVAVALAGCVLNRPSAVDSAREAVQGTWVQGAGVDTPEVPFVSFRPDRAWIASDGCDRVYGTWRITAQHRLSVVVGPHAPLECAGEHMVTTVAGGGTARVPRGTSQLRIESGGTRMRLDPADGDTVDSLDRPIGYWVQDHSSDAPYLSLRADDTFRLFDGCVTRTGTWRWSHTEQVRLYAEAQTGEFCADADPDLRRSTRGRVDGDTIALSRTDGGATGTLHRYAG